MTATETSTNPPGASTPAGGMRTLTQDRFLLAILGGIGLLVLLALITIVATRRPVADLPANTPGGTVQRFYQALETRDYHRAYDLLSDRMADKPTREDFLHDNANRTAYDTMQQRIRITEERITGDNATITASVTQYSPGSWPFGGTNEYTMVETFSLRLEDGLWRITDLPYRYRPISAPKRP